MNNQIYDEATGWLLKHRDGELGPKDKGDFDAWLRESPQHVRAYLEMSAIWEDLPALGADWNATPDQLIARARSEDNVRPLVDTARITGAAADDRRTFPAPQASTARRAYRARFLALAAVFLVTIAGIATWYGLERDVYRTDIGEQRSILLADGSTLELNSRSQVRIRYTHAQRDVDLLEGQAIFRVAHDAARPFVVHSGITRIVAVGTQFDVYKKQAATVVTVVEGKVEVLDRAPASTAPNVLGATSLPLAPAKSGGAIFLATGEQLTIPTGKPARATTASAGDKPQPADVAAATAWTQHNLVFESSPLTEVAEEFNRYNRRPLVITDPGIANIRISGMFSSADPGLFLKFLRAQPELTVEETDREIRIGAR